MEWKKKKKSGRNQGQLSYLGCLQSSVFRKSVGGFSYFFSRSRSYINHETFHLHIQLEKKNWKTHYQSFVSCSNKNLDGYTAQQSAPSRFYFLKWVTENQPQSVEGTSFDRSSSSSGSNSYGRSSFCQDCQTILNIVVLAAAFIRFSWTFLFFVCHLSGVRHCRCLVGCCVGRRVEGFGCCYNNYTS